MADQRPARSFLDDTDLTDEEVAQALIAGLDEALGSPARERRPAGTVLLREGQDVDGIRILIEGRVELTRESEWGEVRLHAESAGRIIGLMALAQRHRSLFTCRALTEVTYIPLGLAQLDEILHRSRSLAVHFDTALIRSLARRERRATELRVQVRSLNHSLAQERDQLAEALEQLKRAELRLVESEKMATLGQLCAGVAHELNNPITAIRRRVDHLLEDLTALLEGLCEDAAAADSLRAAMESQSLSTREERSLRGTLAAAVGDEELARRLIRVGVTTVEGHRAEFGALSQEERNRRLSELETHHRLARTLRDLATAAERVTGLVKSLRAYARRDEGPVAGVNLHAGLEDTLALFGHALDEITVERCFGQIPAVECHVGEINQVWTNLISNALEAMSESGRLTIETDSPDPDHVRVRVTDTGHGIAPEHLDRVFELNFTTRRSTAQFGLGLGLALCRQIVNRHSGTITVESRPGHTCFSVVLPVRQSHQAKAEAEP